ncbi:MAG: hypothetical protein AAF367_13660 [Pseudomonadota bacterium]
MKLFFRQKDNGATVLRVVEDARQQRIDLLPLAEVNTRNGSIKPRNGVEISTDENVEIARWIEQRQARDATDQALTPRHTIEALNAAAHWISSKPDPAAADNAIDDLLLAMYDLRTAIIRYKSKNQQDEGGE